MEEALSIAGIALAAFLLPLLGSRVGLPGVVLEIGFGIVAGPSVLGWIHSSEATAYLAELGFLLLMFLSGFEIDFGRLLRQGPAQLATGMSVFLITLALAYGAALAFGQGPFFTLLLATTSVGIVVPTLRSTRHSGSALGQAILISALLADFLTLVAVTLFAVYREHGLGSGLLGVPLMFLVIGSTLIALRRAAWWFPERFERLFEADDPEEMGIRSCLAMMFVFVGLSHLLGIEPILGAFLAGSSFALVFRHRGALERKLTGFAFGFFIPIFFIHVGIQFDLASLAKPHVLLGAVALIFVAIGVKLLAASVLFFRGFGIRDVAAAGMLLSARLSLVIAVAELGAKLGLLDRALEAQVVLLAIVTSILSPTLFRALAKPNVVGHA